MDIQKEIETPNGEFNETINLVEAVLERLEFHAFEEVLIWSNEHASRALLLCLKKTIKEFKDGKLFLTSSYPKLKHFSVDSIANGLMTALDQAQDRQDSLYREIDELKDQLTKAKAVPEGFVLVPKERLAKAVDGIEALFKEDCALALGELLPIQQDLNAMIEAQEQCDD